MNNKKLITAFFIAAYLLGAILSYRQNKKLFMKMNKKYNIGQPKFSKQEQLLAIGISSASWIGYIASLSYDFINYSNLDKEPAYEF